MASSQFTPMYAALIGLNMCCYQQILLFTSRECMFKFETMFLLVLTFQPACGTLLHIISVLVNELTTTRAVNPGPVMRFSTPYLQWNFTCKVRNIF